MIQLHKIDEEQHALEITVDAVDRKIKSVEDIMDFFGDCYVHNCTAMIIHRAAFDDCFFDLKTKIAGDILQKLSTYRMKLAIIGDFSAVESKSLRDFIRESNERKFINFTDTVSKAMEIFKHTKHPKNT
jgi:hypothetical protein